MRFLYRLAVGARVKLLIAFLIVTIVILLLAIFRLPVATPEPTPTPSATAPAVQPVVTATALVEQTPTPAATTLLTPTSTITLTVSSPPTPVPTPPDTPTLTETPTPTLPSTVTETPIATPSPTVTVLPTITPIPTATPTELAPWTPTPTATLTGTLSVALIPVVSAPGVGANPCTNDLYRIQLGDTLTSIAFRFDVSVANLMLANPTINSDPLQVEGMLLIPCPQATGLTLPSSVNVPVMPQLLGNSTGGWPIEVFQFGAGPTRLVFVGGIHGGYEWNTILLAYAAIDYFSTHPEAVPPAITVYIIPAANPDGLVRLTGQSGRFTPDQLPPDTVPGRFNINGVDLNRNWDCRWQAQAVWGNQPVDGGRAPFSEIETQVLRHFLTNPPADGIVFWHSAQPGVFPGACDGRLAAADEIALLYATASAYPFFTSFDNYPVTGDAADWLVQQGIPAIEVELTNHTDLEWERNLRAILALVEYFANLK